MTLFSAIYSAVIDLVTNQTIISIVGLILAYHFRVFNRAKKLWAYFAEKRTQAEITVRLNSEKTPKQIGENICAIWKNNKLPCKVTMGLEHDYEMTNNRYNIMIHQDEDEIVFRTSVLDTTLGQIQSKFSETLKLIEDEKISHVFINAVLPYKFEFVELKPPSWIEIEEYQISFKKNETESHVSLELKNNKSRVMINGKSIHDIYPLIKKVFSPLS